MTAPDHLPRNLTLVAALRELDPLLEGLSARLEISVLDDRRFMAMIVPKEGRTYHGIGRTSKDAIIALTVGLRKMRRWLTSSR